MSTQAEAGHDRLSPAHRSPGRRVWGFMCRAGGARSLGEGARGGLAVGGTVQRQLADCSQGEPEALRPKSGHTHSPDLELVPEAQVACGAWKS